MLKLTTMTATALVAALFTGLAEQRASAYQFFTDRDTWNTAIQESIITEHFNSAPNGLLAPDTIFPSGVKFVDSGFLSGAAVSGGAVQVGLAFPGSVEEFTFPTAVEGFGFDFEKLGIEAPADKVFSVRGNFGSSGILPNNGFFGVVAEADDPLIARFQILSQGEIGSLAIDNVSFPRSVPEPGNVVILISLSLGWLLKKKKTIS
jgi:hypothetical protein